MPDLFASLQKQDLGHLRIVAEFWGFELESSDADSALEELCASLLDLEAVAETLDVLSSEARSALNALITAGGKMEWAIFARKYGEVREMGEGRRDRERPHLKPTSTSEILFYRSLLAKAFFETEKGLQEFAYIPEDLLEIIVDMQADPSSPAHTNDPLGRPATPVEKAHEIPATDHILDDATTYLAALRLGMESGGLPNGLQEHTPLGHLAPVLQKILAIAGLLKKNALQPEAVKKFLEASRNDALDLLYTAWYNSTTFDELRMLPGLICEGEWTNQPQVTREFLMNLINDLPQGKWWSISAFVKAIKEKYPDYQRPAGDYDSWFIKRESDGQFLRGFAYWDSIDGALIRHVIQILHLVGRVDLAAPEEGKEATAFKIQSKVDGRKSTSDGKIIVSSNGKIAVSRMFSRAVRYQIARFCEWGEEKNDEFNYFVSARSLKRANEQGLKAEQLLAMLVKYTNGNVAPALVKSLKRWDSHGAEARVESLLVLRVSSPEVMEEMRKSKAGKFLGEMLSPTAVVVKNGAVEKVMAALTELGLLAEVHLP